MEAATAYGVALDGPGLLDPGVRDALLDRVAASRERGRLDEVLGSAAEVVTSRLGISSDVLDASDFVWRVVPAGWVVREYDDENAVVAVWATGVVMANGRTLATPEWRTSEIRLTWERSAWRLVSFRTEAGPQPPSVGETGGTGAAHAMNAFAPYRYVAISHP